MSPPFKLIYFDYIFLNAFTLVRPIMILDYRDKTYDNLVRLQEITTIKEIDL